MCGAVTNLAKRIKELVSPIGDHGDFIEEKQLGCVAETALVVGNALCILALCSNQRFDKQFEKAVGNQDKRPLIISNLRQLVENRSN